MLKGISWNKTVFTFNSVYCSVGWGCRRVRPPNECPGYDTKQSDGEDSEMLELWGMRSNPSLISLPSPLWTVMEAPDKVPSIGQIELNCVLMLNWIVWNITVLKLKL